MTALAPSTPVAQRRIPFWARLIIWSLVGIVAYFALLVAIQYLSIVNSVDPGADKANALATSAARGEPRPVRRPS